MKTFEGNFTQQEPISEEAVLRACDVLRSGRLHRYNLAPGEVGEVAQLEAEFAKWQSSEYALAVSSGGQAMQIALRASGVDHGDIVLTNSFTLAPVPGAIEAVGAQAVFVEIDENLRLDLDDLERKSQAHQAKVLLLSHMRGHLCDMERVVKICKRHQLTLIEDCAHTMGAKWKGIRSGNFGVAGCFSTQTYKHINSGEGGLISSSAPEFMARATILSGSYMLYERHEAGPDAAYFEEVKYLEPNCSARMDALRAAILRVQLSNIDHNIERWNARYDALSEVLNASAKIVLPKRPKEEDMVGSSLQFRVPDLSYEACEGFVREMSERGVELKWFGRNTPLGFTSAHQSWRYLEPQNLPQTDKVMACLFDLRLPLTFSLEDCRLIGEIICEVVEKVQ